MVDHSKILIIGVDSFTGRHLKSFFENNGFDVYGTTFSSLIADKKVYQLDILNTQELIDIFQKVEPDYIISLAAISFVGEPNKELFYKVNVIGTELILSAITDSGLKPKKVLIPSSAVVYGDQNSSTLSEDMAPNPKNHYGYSKLVSEQICKTYFDKLNIVVPRPFNYTGVGQNSTFLIPKIVEAFKRGDHKISLGNLNTFREFNDVLFVCECYQKLLGMGASSVIVNVCTGNIVSGQEVLELMNNIGGYEIDVDIDKRFVRSNEIERLAGDNTLLKSLIGELELSKYSFNSLLKRMYSLEA